MNGVQDMMDYWRAEWRNVTDHSAATNLEKLFAQSNDEIIIDDVFLRKAQATWFPDAIMPTVLSIEKVPSETKEKMRENNAFGATRPVVLKESRVMTGESRMYFDRKKVNNNVFVLFYCMGHELIHVSQYSVLKGEVFPKEETEENIKKNKDLYGIMDYYAYYFEYLLRKKRYVPTEKEIKERNMYEKDYPDWFEKLDWHNFGWTEWNDDKYGKDAQYTRYKYPLDEK